MSPERGDQPGDGNVGEPSPGAGLIDRERRRQSEQERYTAEHDARHTGGELAVAAWCYLTGYLDEQFGLHPDEPRGRNVTGLILWPWSADTYKPSAEDPVRQLAKTGALIAAEIDRLLAAADAGQREGAPAGLGDGPDAQIQ